MSNKPRPLPKHMQCFIRREKFMTLNEALYYCACGYDMDWYFKTKKSKEKHGQVPQNDNSRS